MFSNDAMLSKSICTNQRVGANMSGKAGFNIFPPHVVERMTNHIILSIAGNENRYFFYRRFAPMYLTGFQALLSYPFSFSWLSLKSSARSSRHRVMEVVMQGTDPIQRLRLHEQEPF